jgi:hypothetical protein
MPENRILANDDLAGSSERRQPEDAGDGRVWVPEPQKRGAGNDSDQTVALFQDNEAGEFREKWESIQTGFVDEPRKSVEEADQLVSAVIKRLSESFANERSSLERQWASGNENASTEDLRIALRRYRSFFQRLLSV